MFRASVLIGSNFLEEKTRPNGRIRLFLNVLKPGILSSSLCSPNFLVSYLFHLRVPLLLLLPETDFVVLPSQSIALPHWLLTSSCSSPRTFCPIPPLHLPSGCPCMAGASGGPSISTQRVLSECPHWFPDESFSTGVSFSMPLEHPPKAKQMPRPQPCPPGWLLLISWMEACTTCSDTHLPELHPLQQARAHPGSLWDIENI